LLHHRRWAQQRVVLLELQGPLPGLADLGGQLENVVDDALAQFSHILEGVKPKAEHTQPNALEWADEGFGLQGPDVGEDAVSGRSKKWEVKSRK